MKRGKIQCMCPFFIVSDVPQSIAFYCEKLGFEIEFKQPEHEPFFAIVQRDGNMVFLKSGDVKPLPNPKRDPDMRWDCYCSTANPDDLAAEFAERGAKSSQSLENTHSGLRGFEVTDPDGYVLFFGRPKS